MVELTFITSSKIKLAHAEHLCREYNVRIGRQRNYGVGYQEPRIRERKALLEQSLRDALMRWKKNVSRPEDKFFFIEDTSVIIHALSKDGVEIPGVDVKYWMQDHDFDSVDRLLKEHGNDRRVTVRSDVLLTLPERLAKEIDQPYIQFTSVQHGSITEQEYQFQTNPLYPWLDNRTFNKWFVPDGCNKPISMLPIEEADRFDFRAGAFADMLKFLENHGEVRKREEAKRIAPMVQRPLPVLTPLIIISGPTCAGKTTLAEYIVQQYGYYHIEASDFMYLSYYEKHGAGSSVKISEFALSALKEKPSIVSEKILEFLSGLKESPVVVTGFRTKEEVEHFRSIYSGGFPIELVIVDADKNLRMKRFLKRNREGDATVQRFVNEDCLQKEMGLGELMVAKGAHLIVNNASFEAFYRAFDKKFGPRVANLKPLELIERAKPKRLEDAILIALESEGSGAFTTSGIAKLIKDKLGIFKSKNNVSRYFNQKYHPYYEIHVINDIKHFSLSQTGKMQAKWLRRQFP